MCVKLEYSLANILSTFLYDFSCYFLERHRVWTLVHSMHEVCIDIIYFTHRF